MQRILALCLSLNVAACASDEGPSSPEALESVATPTVDGPEKDEESSQEDGGDVEAAASTGRSVDSETLETKIVETDVNSAPASVGEEISADSNQMPLEINEAVSRWIEYFTVRDPERFRRFLERGEQFRGMITAVLREQGVPTEVFYLAMIESGFATHARSHAKAVGIWQFMKGTAKRYGLRVDKYVDERRDPMRATAAAALYLKDLHNVFQNWYLAMAAYNAGEGRIVSAIMRAKTRDFWEIARLRALPRETMQYIPKFLAATTIGHNLRKYGIEEITPQARPAVTPVAVPSPVRLADIAKVSGVEVELLKKLNPHLLRGMTPPGVAHYRLWVPRELVGQVEGQQDKLAHLRLRGVTKLTGADGRPGNRHKRALLAALGGDPNDQLIFHKVARGDTLGKIAAKYGTSIRTLRKVNKIHSHRIAAGIRLIVGRKPPLDATKDAGTDAIASPLKRKTSEQKELVQRYRVQRGDSLDRIARRFNLRVHDLKRVNRLQKNRIYAGQVLRLPQDEG